MSDLKDKARKLIEKGKRLGDLELIEMAMDVLEMIHVEDDSIIVEQPKVETKVVKKTRKVKAEAVVTTTTPEKAQANSRVDHSMFKINNPERKSRRAKGVPVTANASERINRFVDDGKESRGPEFITPKYEPTARRPPVEEQKIIKKCEGCGKEEKVLPDFVYGEYYRCNSCLLKGKK